MKTAKPGTTHWLNTRERYGSISIALHWLMLLLLIAVYATMELEEAFSGGEGAMKAWHYVLGLGVLVLVGVRLVARLSRPVPTIHPQPAAWQHMLAKLTHLALYLFMIAMPLLGWLALSGEHDEPVRIPLLGWSLPLLPGVTESVAEAAEELHEGIAVLGYWLVGLHATAALVHHYLIRDDTLRRMLPRWFRGRSRTPRLPNGEQP